MRVSRQKLTDVNCPQKKKGSHKMERVVELEKTASKTFQTKGKGRGRFIDSQT